MSKIRLATLEDLLSLRQLIQESFKESIQVTGEEPLGYDDVIKLQNHILDSHCYLLENEVSKKKIIVAGYIFYPTYPKSKRVYYLSRIFVHPSFQSRGFGKELVEHMLSNKNVKVWKLHAVSSNINLKKFYESFGFKKVSEEKPRNVVLSVYQKEMK
jgi:ribosomal protein S18 acetylase RimI-like enzyme